MVKCLQAALSVDPFTKIENFYKEKLCRNRIRSLLHGNKSFCCAGHCVLYDQTQNDVKGSSQFSEVCALCVNEHSILTT